MKELSIEEKAKRYDKAVERLRAAFYDDNNRMCEEYCSACKRIIEPIFPELAESEDERIRKDIIWCLKRSGIKESNPINPHVTTIVKDAIAWLEKQGEQKPQGKTALEAAKEVKVDNQNCVKPADKVDPKQEWSEEDRQTLRLIIDDLSEELNDEPDEADKEILCRKISFLNSLKPHPIHKWDREDNKIRLEINNYLECQKREEPTRTDILNKWIAWIANLDPQCKKNTAWSEEDSKIRNEIINYFECQSEEEPTIEDVHNRWIAWLANTPWLKNNLPTALSKEEEQILGFIIEDIVDQIDDPGTDDGDRALYNKEAKLLQSLKYRVLPQTKQEWSNEDERKISDVIVALSEYANGNIPTILPSILLEDVDWLKSLKDRVQPKPKQEWSEENKKILNYLLWFYDTRFRWNDTCNGDIKFGDIVTFLKSLRPQNRWKPSDLQLECLSDAIKHYNSQGYDAPILKKLLDELSKLK